MTIANIITIAKISEYLASNDIGNSALYGAQPNPNLPAQIYLITKGVEQRYIDEGSPATPSASLLDTANYLYAFCKQYAMQAWALINSGQAWALINSGSAIPSTSVLGGLVLYGHPISGVYTAISDGETVLNLGIPSGAIVWQASKSLVALTSSQYSYSEPNLTLLGGISLSADEPLSYSYVLPI